MSPAGLGELLRRSREAKGLSVELLARALNLSPGILIQLESDDWDSLPAGQARPLARQMAQRLDVDLESCRSAFARLPGGADADAPDPANDRIERIVMAALTVGCAGLLAWLIIPGRNLRQGAIAPEHAEIAPPPPQANGERKEGQSFPVLGEVLPEAPRTEEGTLVSIRVLDACQARIVGEGMDRTRELRVSEPWLLRVKGAFELTLDNAGVASVEVGGRRIRHSHSVGESWTGRFAADGLWLRATPPLPDAATGPETHVKEPDEKG